jgi:signal transduction histidine kinase
MNEAQNSGPLTGLITDRRLHRQVLIGSNLIFLLLVLSSWGHFRTVAALVALQVCRILVNKLGEAAIERAARAKRRAVVGFAALAGGNLALNVAVAYTGGWALPFLVFIPFHVLVTGCYAAQARRAHLLPIFLVFPVAALLAGVSALVVATFILLAFVIWSVSNARAEILDETHASLRAKHEELADALLELRALQAKMVEQEKLAGLGILAAGIAHEINNPMSFVTSNVQTLLQDIEELRADDGMAREYIEEILPATIDGIGRVNTIVADLRRFARAEGDGSAEFDLNEQVEVALRLSANETKHHCRVETNLGKVPRIVGRPQQIVQVIVNLVVNAAQATRSDGLVQVVTRVAGEHVLVEVKDNGIGMTPEVKSRLFQPFFTTKRVGEGTGLGLAVSHGVAKSHGGEIDVESQPGRGSTFILRLPCSRVQRAPPQGKPARRKGEPEQRGLDDVSAA